MPLRPDVEVFAERTLECLKPSGERLSVVLRFGQPYRASDVDWACPVAADGLYERLADIHGIDSLQALILAQELLRSLMQDHLERGHRFYWPGTSDVMTLEQIFGKAI
jgi:hypothetical protein